MYNALRSSSWTFRFFFVLCPMSTLPYSFRSLINSSGPVIVMDLQIVSNSSRSSFTSNKTYGLIRTPCRSQIIIRPQINKKLLIRTHQAASFGVSSHAPLHSITTEHKGPKLLLRRLKWHRQHCHIAIRGRCDVRI